jgi:hypothetical protein
MMDDNDSSDSDESDFLEFLEAEAGLELEDLEVCLIAANSMSENYLVCLDSAASDKFQVPSTAPQPLDSTSSLGEQVHLVNHLFLLCCLLSLHTLYPFFSYFSHDTKTTNN